MVLSQRTIYQTAGVELIGGFNLFQINAAELEIGIKAAYRIDEGNFRFGGMFDLPTLLE